jgi:hypothetical protein
MTDYFRKEIDKIFDGIIQEIYQNQIIVILEKEDMKAQGILSIREISNSFFVDDFMLHKFFKIGSKYTFEIKNFDKKNNIFILSRKKYLRKIELRYGEQYQCIAVNNGNKTFVYGNDIEGILVNNYPERIDDDILIVSPASFKKINEFYEVT